MALRILAVAMACAAVLQDPADEIGRAILRLSDEDPQVRAKAEAALMASGAKAVPALREAYSSANSRTRENARRLFAMIDRIEFEKFHDAENRKEAMQPTEDGNIQNAYPFTLEGGRFKTAAYTDRGGLAIRTIFASSFYFTEFDFDIATVTDKAGKAVPVTRCGVCSPRWVHVSCDAPLKVSIKGTRRWYSEYDVKFENPKEGDQKRVGDFTITVKWPELEVASARGYSDAGLGRVARYFLFNYKDPDKSPLVGGGGGGGHYSGRLAPKHTTWCMCEGGPKPVQKLEPKRSTTFRIKYAFADTKDLEIPAKVDEVAEICLSFNKPIEEPFEVKSPEISPSKVLGER